MKKIAALSALSFALFGLSIAAHAAPTTELKVTGVIKPPACTPAFTGGGVVDYGVIPAGSLKAGAYTTLPSKEIGMSINCDANVKVAFKTVDNRANSTVAGIVAEPNSNFGLGRVDGKNVGGYTVQFSSNSSADAKEVSNIGSADGGKSWFNGVANVWTNNTLFSFSNGNAAPVAFKQLNAKFNVTAVINKPENLNLSQDVPLDGSATFEVIYL